MAQEKTKSRGPRRIQGVDDVTTYVGQRLDASRRAGGPLEAALCSELESGLRLEGKDGQERLQRARAQVEQLIAETLGKLDAMTMLLAARSVSPRVWTTLGPVGDEVQPGVRRTLELAIRKHCSWKSTIRQMEALPSFLPSHLSALAKAFVYSEAYVGLMATERRVCKGQAHVVTKVAHLDFEAEGGLIDRLIDIVDSRSFGAGDPLAPFGTVSNGGAPRGVPFILGADFVEASEVVDFVSGDFTWEYLYNGRTVRTADRTARWGFIEDLEAFQDAVAVYDASLRKTAGYGMIDLIAIQHLASMAVLEGYEGRDLPPVFELLGFGIVSPIFINMVLDVSGTHPYDAMTPDRQPTPASLSHAYARLIVRPDEIDLSNPTVVPPLIDVPGGGIIYDLTAAALLGPLYIEHTLEESDRQAFTKDFEVRTQAILADLGKQPWGPGKLLKVHGKTFTDVDVSVQIGDVLVVVDCYSSPWNRHLDSGAHAKVRNRADHLIAKLEDWQRQWIEIAANHAHHVPVDVQQVLPIVVTAGPEWISSDAPHLWLTPDLPAILTVQEAHRLLASNQLPRAHLIDVDRS